jgi:hypothetical protein
VIVFLFDKKARDLLHAPAVGERLGPERIDAVLRCAIRVESLPSYHLRVSDGRCGIRHEQGQADSGSCSDLSHTNLLLLLALTDGDEPAGD